MVGGTLEPDTPGGGGVTSPLTLYFQTSAPFLEKVTPCCSVALEEGDSDGKEVSPRLPVVCEGRRPPTLLSVFSMTLPSVRPPPGRASRPEVPQGSPWS